MTRPIYLPGDVDEAAYGPPAWEETLPPKPEWTPAPGREQEAFMAWCLTMLDREFEERDLEAAIREMQADDQGYWLLREMADQVPFEQARKLMPHLTWEGFERYRYGTEDRKPRKAKRGAKGNAKVAAARMDNARLTIIWRKYFDGQDRRQCKPSRLDILQRRHELNEGERETIENYLFKLK